MNSAGGLDVSATELALIRTILTRHIPGREVWAFGSRTTGKARQYSDLDLCVIGEEPLDKAVMSALAEDFSDSDLPYKIDLVDWASMRPAFRDIVRENRIVIPSI